ncbi:NepR family anti-sigma factor [Aurantiacibacter aquimixticola]|uniref:Anti-sigma factor NepR domain-containing protein n=1 Tax=Aurantiacibacter aquimixticola TaxID=1958945 RepID=A0A419RTU2_9SPHN|nr:NepR family anti-sigma factor [Aurantiacibacter aquimixticola]RJY09207.1 hypothetical protein D6201_07415 [Aurantiacibacter aquimixticola]
MTSSEDQAKKVATPSEKADDAATKDPEWKSGLKRLYDSVLDEPLPDTFKDLLSKLDEDEGK